MNIRGWLTAMSLDQRRDLQGRVDTQVLLDERVLVTKISGQWAQVVVPDQPTPFDPRGYPGWIPLAQLSFAPPDRTPDEAVVVTPTTWLFSSAGSRSAEVSFGTRLPAIKRTSSWVTVRPAGSAAPLRVRSADVVVTAHGTTALPISASDIVRAARAFQGLPYLWGGTSGFGFDCSGFTYLDYLAHGIVLPRDADAQALTGTAVARAGLRPADLLYFASRGLIHHVAMYIGSGLMVQSPQTGSTIQVVAVASQPYAAEYWGARRYIR